MKKIVEVLFIFSVLLCGISVLMMATFMVPFIIGMAENYGQKGVNMAGLILFAPFALAGMLFWCLGPDRALEIVDKLQAQDSQI